MNEFVNDITTNGLMDANLNLQTIWNLRESIAGAGLVQGYVFKYDVSLPIQHYYDLVPKLQHKLGDKALIVCGYGHVGKYI